MSVLCFNNFIIKSIWKARISLQATFADPPVYMKYMFVSLTLNIDLFRSLQKVSSLKSLIMISICTSNMSLKCRVFKFLNAYCTKCGYREKSDSEA